MTEFEPIDTESVRNTYVDRWGPDQEAYDEFDHWLAKHDADLLREQARGLSWFMAQGNLVEPDTASAGVQACIRSLNYVADELEGKK